MHNTAESLYKSLGMDVLPDEYLPDDYTGPSAGPLQQIVRTYSDNAIENFYVSLFSNVLVIQQML